jgi:hypothetical protein
MYFDSLVVVTQRGGAEWIGCIHLHDEQLTCQMEGAARANVPPSHRRCSDQTRYAINV